MTQQPLGSPMVSFYVTNIPRHISQTLISQVFSTYFPGSLINLYPISKRKRNQRHKVAHLTVPQHLARLCPVLTTAASTDDGTPANMPPIGTLFFRPFKRKPKRSELEEKIKHLQTQLSQLQTANSSHQHSPLPTQILPAKRTFPTSTPTTLKAPAQPSTISTFIHLTDGKSVLNQQPPPNFPSYDHRYAHNKRPT